MDTFDEWIKTVQYPCIQEWGEKVVALGASWDSFRRDDKNQITNDLVNGGIPILAARDIVDIATSEVQRSTAPMAIFWDLENMPIPAQVSGRDMTSVLKNILAPHGDLIQFRGYASIGMNLIPQEKRSDLQLSGCHLVDCPHHGRKEVADKMIIVDAMHFAYQHLEAATLCFITGDVDYAYLLAVLQQRPQWRTIVISRGTMQSMLHVNCHMKMRWETDVLQSIYSSREERDDDNDSATNDSVASGDSTDENDSTAEQFAPLTADEFWKDDVELLRSVMIQEGRRVGTRTPRKSNVGNILRQTNPARFPNRETIRDFFAKAIEKRVVRETGDGPFKTLALVETSHSNGWHSVSSISPIPADEMPPKALEMASNNGLHFILFVPKMYCPPGFDRPKKAFIQSSERWLLLLYPSHGQALQSATSPGNEWLRHGTLVDWRKVTESKKSVCTQCSAHSSEQNLATFHLDGKSFCSPECMKWSVLGAGTKLKAVDCVVETLQFLAANDDILINQSLLPKIVAERHHPDCINKKFAKLWIKESILSGATVEIKRMDSRAKKICLAAKQSEALEDMPPADHPTSDKEEFVQDLLWEDGNLGALDRQRVAEALDSCFDDMNTPFRRNQVLANAQATGKLFLHRGTFRHMVGLTKEMAESAIAHEMEKIGKEYPHPFDTTATASDSTERISAGNANGEGDDSDSADIMSSRADLGANGSDSEHEPATAHYPALSESDLASSGTERTQEPARLPKILSHIDDHGNYATKNLYVSGFGAGTTKREVYQLFKRFSNDFEVVSKTHFMFVNTASKEEAMAARMQLHGTALNGGKLKINFAKAL